MGASASTVYFRDSCRLSSLDVVTPDDLEGLGLVIIDPSTLVGSETQGLVSRVAGSSQGADFSRIVSTPYEVFPNILTDADIFVGNSLCAGRLIPGMESRPFGNRIYNVQAAFVQENRRARKLFDHLAERWQGGSAR